MLMIELAILSVFIFYMITELQILSEIRDAICGETTAEEEAVPEEAEEELALPEEAEEAEEELAVSEEAVPEEAEEAQ